MAYNTVLTVMRMLRDKGFLSSTREGRMDLYSPLVERAQMAQNSYREVVSAFYSGSAQQLASQLLSSEELSDEELRSLRKQINEKLGRK